MAEYNLEGGLKQPWKDFIDCARYGAVSGIYPSENFIEPEATTRQMPSYGAPTRTRNIDW